jgi:Zn-dependent membrane protease YugP
MGYVLIAVLLLAALLGPGLWVRRVMQRYLEPSDRYARSGREVARHFLDAHGLAHVRCEVTEQGDHYDPQEKAVRLMPQHYEGRSLAAVTIAAHEVGHALQDASGYAPLHWRTRLVRWLAPVEKTGAVLLMGAPLIVGLTRLPVAGLLVFLGGLMALGSSIVIHALTLPTEFDASFGRALPMLEREEVLYDNDRPHAKKLLRAAALTYVSASLMSLLNIARWWAILRR